ncbi:MAG: acyl-[acyl-carrier-protein]--UDP-N-acetylglucosamine O-acyltransferase [Rhodospirillales bacterium 20-60-12]|nr:MAG: acyl-[acyl-carrier-protein]--UDP-N-acetylglucosamine O-acyltransferase [Rhodospirillales bacterium 20-60-12]HQT68341.1 acyl-ACP--UDP-N-acetylglucosamine O-acyltransferase [Acetobacteraceae bacterium]
MIHPQSVIAQGARLGANVRIGPFCTVGPDVEIGDGAELISHVAVDGRTRIGAGAKLFPFCTVGLAPQDLKYKGEDTATEIGARTMIREHCSVHRGTITGSGITRIGDDCLIMAVVHVAHDCQIGHGVVIANNVVMGGHVSIGDRAVIGGSAALHQFVRIGAGAMIGGVSGVEADVIPFGSVIGNRARLVGLNIIGLRRRGLDRAGLHRMRALYNELFTGPGIFVDRLAAARISHAGDPFADDIFAFIDTPSKRGLIRAASAGLSDEDG